MSRRVIDNCQNTSESYNEICVYCNKCGRYETDPDKRKLEREQEAIVLLEFLRKANLPDSDGPINFMI